MVQSGTSSVHVYESNELQKHYEAIAAFFSGYSLFLAQQVLTHSLRVAGGGYVYKANPSGTLYFFELLEKLVLAELAIHKSGSKRDAAIIKERDNPPDLTSYSHYFGWHHHSAPLVFLSPAP
jgi:hypothetical protein